MKKAIAVLLAVYVCMLGYLYFNQQNLLYHPEAGAPDLSVMSAGAPVEVQTEDGLMLRGWYVPPAQKNAAVLVLFHGNTKDFTSRASKMAHYIDAGYGVLLTEYRGFGGNPGSPTEQGLYADARAFVEWLHTQGIATDHMILYGESLGTGVAVQMATEYQVAALVLEAAYSSTADVAQHEYPYVPVAWLMKDQYRSINKIAAVEEPLLQAHGTDDHVIPYQFGQALFAAATEPKTFVTLPGAGHNDLYDHGMALHVLAFLRTIGAAVPQPAE